MGEELLLGWWLAEHMLCEGHIAGGGGGLAGRGGEHSEG